MPTSTKQAATKNPEEGVTDDDAAVVPPPLPALPPIVDDKKGTCVINDLAAAEPEAEAGDDDDDDDSKPLAAAGSKAKGSKSKSKRGAKSAKKTPVKSSAGRTVAKASRGPGRPRKRRKGDESEPSSDEEEDSAAIPYSAEEFPQLALDSTKDHVDLATAFTKPLFNDPSRPLEIAYSHLNAASAKRKKAQRKKNAILQEYNALRDKFQQKKLELSLANDEVKGHSQTVGTWTRKVFDLELEEPCSWNDNYRKLKAYREEHGRLPPNSKKAKDDEEKFLASWLDRIRGQKNQEERDDDAPEDPAPPKKKRGRSKKFVRDYPHRLDRLASLGVVWENHNENKWETMFQKLLVYKEEMGTLRFPTDDQCAATGDEELMALQKWVKSQVLAFRYGKKKNAEMIKRLNDIGFDFEKWYAKPSKGRRKSTGVDNDGMGNGEAAADDLDRKMPAKEADELVGDVEMKVGQSMVV